MATATMNGNKTVTATAKLKNYKITCGSGGTGQNLQVTVTGYGTLTDGGSYTVPYNTAFTAKVTAKDGYTAGTVSKASGNVTSDMTITATAATIKKYTVTLGSRPNCSVTISGGGLSSTNANLANVPHGTTVTVTATPNTGYNVSEIKFS